MKILHRLGGFGAEFACGLLVKVPQFLQALLQAGHVVAVVAVCQQAVFGAFQLGGGGLVYLAGFGQAVFLLEFAHGGPGAVQKIAADLAGIVPQVFQLLLKLADGLALGAVCQHVKGGGGFLRQGGAYRQQEQNGQQGKQTLQSKTPFQTKWRENCVEIIVT